MRRIDRSRTPSNAQLSSIKHCQNLDCGTSIGRAKRFGLAWPFLRSEPDVSEDLRAKAAELEDLLARETFYRELPAIEQHASAIDAEYTRRFDEALEARIAAYTQALERLAQTPGWDSIDEDQQTKLAAPLERGTTRDQERVPIPQLRSELDACETVCRMR